MKANNMGILFYGSKGTGKTFYASCIANALTEKNVTTAFTTVANLMSVLSGRYKVEAIDAISRVQLLVLDDLDTERNTSYGMELLYTVIDTRYRSGKPTIITTNLEIENMKEETDLALSRVYDRVIEMCPIAMKINGESRRGAIAEDRKAKARKMLTEIMKDIAYGD
jgi:DNA replication protein DnaC